MNVTYLTQMNSTVLIYTWCMFLQVKMKTQYNEGMCHHSFLFEKKRTFTDALRHKCSVTRGKVSIPLQCFDFTFIFFFINSCISLEEVWYCFDGNSLALIVAFPSQVKMTCMAFNRLGVAVLHFYTKYGCKYVFTLTNVLYFWQP